MKTPEISVVVAAYNTELYISQCVASILKQTFSDFELIVVDDGSDDHTPDIVQNFIDKGDQRVRLIRNEHTGAGHSRNIGLELARGRYIIFLDADDFFEPDLLKTLYECSEENQTDISVCQARSYNEITDCYKDIWYAFRKEMIPEGVFSRRDESRYIFNMFMGWAWDKMYRTEMVRKNNLQFKNLRSSNDLYFVFMSLAKAERIKAVFTPLVNYRLTNSGSLHNTSHLSWNCFLTAALQLKEGLISEGLYEEVKQSYLNWCADYFHSQIRNRKCSDEAKMAYELVRETGLKEIGFFEMDEDKYFYHEAYCFLKMMKDGSYYDFVNQRYEKVFNEREMQRDDIWHLRDENQHLKDENQQLKMQLAPENKLWQRAARKLKREILNRLPSGEE